jgi:hypothetical protein
MGFTELPLKLRPTWLGWGKMNLGCDGGGMAGAPANDGGDLGCCSSKVHNSSGGWAHFPPGAAVGSASTLLLGTTAAPTPLEV